MSSPELYMGIMSGTSLDGVDAVLVDFADARLPLLGEAHLPFDANLRDELLTLSTAGATDELDRAANTGLTLARLYASAVEQAWHRLISMLRRSRGLAVTGKPFVIGLNKAIPFSLAMRRCCAS